MSIVTFSSNIAGMLCIDMCPNIRDVCARAGWFDVSHYEWQSPNDPPVALVMLRPATNLAFRASGAQLVKGQASIQFRC